MIFKYIFWIFRMLKELYIWNQKKLPKIMEIKCDVVSEEHSM